MKNESRDEQFEGPADLLEQSIFYISSHAIRRMSQRSISQEQLGSVLSHGRRIRSRGACFYVAGRKEVKQCAKRGIDLSFADGIQVVVDEISSTVLTVYKNRDLRQIRPKRRLDRRLH